MRSHRGIECSVTIEFLQLGDSVPAHRGEGPSRGTRGGRCTVTGRRKGSGGCVIRRDASPRCQ